jgi:hypothetical protein
MLEVLELIDAHVQVFFLDLPLVLLFVEELA